jgi:O-antigen ligase
VLRSADIPWWDDPRRLTGVAMVAGAVAAVVTRQPYLLALGPAALVGWLGLHDIRALFLLLLACIPFSAEVELTDTLGTDLPDEPLMWLMTLLLAVHLLLLRREVLAKPADPAILMTLAFHLAWVGFSSLLSTHGLLSLKYLAAKTWYVTAFTLGAWYCLRDRADILRAARILATSMCAATCLVLVKHASLGFAFADANRSVEPLFRNHVNYAALLVCLLPVAIAAWHLHPGQRRRLRWVIGIAAAGLLFSYSRGAWLAAAAGCITVIATRKKILHWVVVTGVAALLGTAAYFLQDDRYLEYSPDYERTIWHGDLGQHMQATYKMTDISSMERFYRWIAAVRMLDRHTLHGYGPNTFYHEYRPYTVNAFRTYVSNNPEHSTVHNYFLLLLVEQGIPGLALFCLLLAVMTRRAYQWYHAARDATERAIPAVILAMLGMIVTLDMLSDLIETDKIGSLFFLCAGLLLQRRWEPSPAPPADGAPAMPGP